MDAHVERVAKEGGEEIWLVKVGQSVSDAWSTLPPGSDLGTLDIIQGKGDREPTYDASLLLTADAKEEDGLIAGAAAIRELSNTLALRMEDVDVEGNAVPRWKELTAERHGTFEGRVTRRFTLKSGTEAQEMEKRFLEEELARPMLQSANERDIERVQRRNMEGAVVTFEGKDQMVTRKKRSRDDRLDDQAIEEHVLRCFEKVDHLTVNEINADINQVPGRIKKVLQKYAVYHNSGKHMSHWELKQEYKSNTKEE